MIVHLPQAKSQVLLYADLGIWPPSNFLPNINVYIISEFPKRAAYYEKFLIRKHYFSEGLMNPENC